MKSVLASIQPKYCELIASGEKTIEVRKNKPKLDTPFKCLIYCTKPSKAYQTICGCMCINTDELFRLPNGTIKHDSSVELMCCDNYSKDNFLNGKVIGEFVCDNIDKYSAEFVNDDCYEDIRKIDFFDDEIEELFITSNGYENPSNCELCRQSCLSFEEIKSYIFSGESGFFDFYGWHISNLKIYDTPKELSEFNLKRPPQSWQYVESEEE